MPSLFGLARIGQDAVLRRTPNGDAVLNVSLAFNYGRKGDDGKRPTQWVDGSMWGNRAEALAPYLLKGQAVAVTLEETHIETYQRSDGSPGSKLVGRIAQIDLAGGKPESGGERAQQQERAAGPAQRNAYADSKSGKAPAPLSAATAFDDTPDDCPF